MERYTAMATLLYTYLSRCDIVPNEYSSIRYIIKHLSKTNDGYLILYEMLELKHPFLQKDPVQLMPTVKKCGNNLDEYASKLDTFFHASSLDGCPFSARAQAVHFILGIKNSIFNYAVERIQQQIDSWQEWEPVVPTDLKLSSLPNTIERYMAE
jgi:hypothetical protein